MNLSRTLARVWVTALSLFLGAHWLYAAEVEVVRPTAASPRVDAVAAGPAEDGATPYPKAKRATRARAAAAEEDEDEAPAPKTKRGRKARNSAPAAEPQRPANGPPNSAAH